MASLLELLFDTMPLSGARLASRKKGGGSSAYRSTPIRYLADQVYKKHRESFKITPHKDDIKGIDARKRPIWSFDASKNDFSAQKLAVRSDEEDFASCLVLENVEFGADFGSGFQNAVEIDVPPHGRKLFRLTPSAAIASLLVRDGCADYQDGSFWPLPAQHEYGILHAFLYEIAPLTGEITPAALIKDPELDKFYKNLKRMTTLSEPGEVGSLFVDNAWEPLPDSSAVVAEVLSKALEWGANKTVSIVPHRILVCCSLTLHKAGDDYTPQKPAWGARFYPVLMVNSTYNVGEVRAGVRFVRPATTTIDEVASADCNCKEMNSAIGVNLFTDANSGNQAVGASNAVGPPAPVWNNLFAYYLIDAFDKLKSLPVQVVYRDHTAPRLVSNVVERLHASSDVHRHPRQGAFDNIHLSPKMKLPRVTRVKISDPVLSLDPSDLPGLDESDDKAGVDILSRKHEVPLSNSDRGPWHFDDISMAPICAHDCFHMHWRWTDLVGATDHSAKGWLHGQPYVQNGFTLVPENQNVFVRLTSARSFDYWGSAGPICKANKWQIFCHHGGGYVLAVKKLVRDGLSAQDLGMFEHNVPVSTFYDGAFARTAKDYWSVFYWRNRFYVDPEKIGGANAGDSIEKKIFGEYSYTVRERVEILDLPKILNPATARPKSK